MKLKQTMLLIFIIILISVQCNTTEPPAKGSLTLTVEDVSCTEAWLQLKLSNISLPSLVTLYKNGAAAQNNILCYGDTLLYVDSLLPNQTYTFQVSSIQYQVSSNKATATTLDTTSHNFTWQTFTFGEHSSSTLYDVAIISENNIWAVGEIYMKDSLSNHDPHAYNAVHWDGQSWELKRIFFPTVCGSTSTTSYPAKAIFAFDDGQIWISSSGDKIARLHNGVQIDKFCLPSNVSMSINKLWGSSSNDLYAVGNGGNIAHYQNEVWTKIESGTTTRINDIWGVNDLLNGERLILCAVSNLFDPGDYKILRINSSNKTDSISWGNGRRISSVWFKNKYKFFTSGGGIFISTAPDYLWKEQTQIPLIYTDRVRGTGLNDVVIVGDFGLVVHFNGYSWITIPEANVALNNSLDYKNNLMISVGQRNQKGVILIGKKY